MLAPLTSSNTTTRRPLNLWLKALTGCVGLTAHLKRGEMNIQVEFSFEPDTKSWATTSLFADEIDGATLRYVTLGNADLPGFEDRYPDVPRNLAHVFVIYHELGHVMKGTSEEAADAYAFEALGITPTANDMRKAKYDQGNGTFKDPFRV